MALYNNTTISNLVAIGDSALFNIEAGAGAWVPVNNTAVGPKALYSSVGGHNTAIGAKSLYYNTGGFYSSAIGCFAFSTGSDYNNSTALGFSAQPGASNTIMLGNTNVAWIGGHSSWYNTSDTRMNNNIREDVKGLDFILEKDVEEILAYSRAAQIPVRASVKIPEKVIRLDSVRQMKIDYLKVCNRLDESAKTLSEIFIK